MRNKVLCKVTDKDKKKIQQQIEVCQPLLQLIYQCCLEDYDKIEKVEDEDFDNPSWALKQASMSIFGSLGPAGGLFLAPIPVGILNLYFGFLL